MLHALPSQLEREIQAFGLMACLAVLLVHIPIRLATGLAPGLFPLDMGLISGFSEAPLDLLLFQVCLPLTAPFFRQRCLPQPPLGLTLMSSRTFQSCWPPVLHSTCYTRHGVNQRLLGGSFGPAALPSLPASHSPVLLAKVHPPFTGA